MAEQGRGAADRFAPGDAAWRTHQFTAADFAAFADATKEVLLHGAAVTASTDFSLILASRQQQIDGAEEEREELGDALEELVDQAAVMLDTLREEE